MRLKLFRYSDNGESTLGLLFIDDKFACYILEDEHRDEKVMHETRIPAGEYRITLRDFGGHHSRYKTKYGADFHRGMLWLKDVPGFEHILIHTGNHDDHTSGCLITGDNANVNTNKDGFVGYSNDAYKRIYPIIRDVLLNGDDVFISIFDEDKFLNQQ